VTALKRAAYKLSRPDAWPTLTGERLLATERAAALLEGRRWPKGRSTATLRRQVLALGNDAKADASVLVDALAADRRSLDRAIILAYLQSMPSKHPAFEAFRVAAETAANRHDWHWRILGEHHRLWSPQRTAAGAWDLADAAKAALVEFRRAPAA
jgi:hypothetical protein